MIPHDEDLQALKYYLLVDFNNFNEAIKFTHAMLGQSINFLDCTLMLIYNKINFVYIMF